MAKNYYVHCFFSHPSHLFKGTQCFLFSFLPSKVLLKAMFKSKTFLFFNRFLADILLQVKMQYNISIIFSLNDSLLLKPVYYVPLFLKTPSLYS